LRLPRNLDPSINTASAPEPASPDTPFQNANPGSAERPGADETFSILGALQTKARIRGNARSSRRGEHLSLTVAGRDQKCDLSWAIKLDKRRSAGNKYSREMRERKNAFHRFLGLRGFITRSKGRTGPSSSRDSPSRALHSRGTRNGAASIDDGKTHAAAAATAESILRGSNRNGKPLTSAVLSDESRIAPRSANSEQDLRRPRIPPY